MAMFPVRNRCSLTRAHSNTNVNEGDPYLARTIYSMKTKMISLVACLSLTLCSTLPAHAETLQWLQLLGSSEKDLSLSVALDKHGNVYISGHPNRDQERGNYYGSDVFAAKFSTDLLDLGGVVCVGSKRPPAPYVAGREERGPARLWPFWPDDVGSDVLVVSFYIYLLMMSGVFLTVIVVQRLAI
jgi:hypothetical protein